MDTFKYVLFTFLSVLALLELCSALECYVCHRQDGNTQKCLNTIKTCEQGEDVCLSVTEWGSPPYWSQGAIKQFYVSKNCSTKAKCHQQRKNDMKLCTHIWYEDWKCTECCQGDRCNYYVISAGNSWKLSTIGTFVASLVIAGAFYLL